MNKMKIFFIGLLAFAVVSHAALQAELHDSTFVGYYRSGFIGIKAWKTNNYLEYKMISDHEYGHHLYNNYLSREERDYWAEIVAQPGCGFESEYARSYRSMGLRLEEEFADSVSAYLNDQSICSYKQWFLARWLSDYRSEGMATFGNYFIYN